MTDIERYVESLCCEAKAAAPALATATAACRNRVLTAAADLLISNCERILAENDKDMLAAEENGVPAVMMDRLKLTEARVQGIADSLRTLADLPDPLGSGDVWTRPNGLTVRRIRVPLGVVGVIYEARPNVTVDVAALCFKTGNAVVLRGGKEALFTNRMLAELLSCALVSQGLPAHAVRLIERTEREGSRALMRMRGLIDVLIPRGSAGLIRTVVTEASVPVIETGAGNCHVFVDATADISMAVTVTENAKLSRPAVCNAAETLLVHKDVAQTFMPAFAEATKGRLELRGCAETCALLEGVRAAAEVDYETEYDDCIMAVKIVSDIGEAIAHINRYSTGHSEAILTNSLDNSKRFCREVDSACVYVNASTRFSDGGEFGFGAEVGISTQKLHARGPMGPEALTTVKYEIEGNGQIR